MTIIIKKKDKEAVIEVGGVLDKTTAKALEKAINDSAKSTSRIVLDLNGIEDISKEGIMVLLKARKEMRSIGSLKLAGICESVMQIIEAGCVNNAMSAE